MEGESPTLSVIVPVFNEAATLHELLNRVLAAPYDKQVIVVNDGSTDESPQILKHWQSVASVEVLQHVRNQGKGAAIRTGVERALGHVVIVQDADLELNPAAYPDLIAPLLADEADFVIGSRFRGRNRSPLLHRWGVLLLNLALRWIYGTRLTDEACCYKALRTETLRSMNLQCERFEFCPEVVAKASRMQLRIQEVPVEYHPRTSAEGKKLRLRDGASALATLWRWRHWTPGMPSSITSVTPSEQSTDGDAPPSELTATGGESKLRMMFGVAGADHREGPAL